MAEGPMHHRIAEQLGVPDIIARLSALKFGDLQSLLMPIMQRKAAEHSPPEILSRSTSNRFAAPCDIPQRAFAFFDGMAYQHLPMTVRSIELSPVVPTGTNSVLTAVSQNNILTTIRSLEVLADPTTAFALECAKMRREAIRQNPRNNSAVTVGGSSRSLRVQTFENIAGFTPHFRSFAMATAGRSTERDLFEKVHTLEHLRFYLALLDALSSTDMFSVRDVAVAISDMRIMDSLIETENLPRAEIGSFTQDPAFNAFERYGINLPSSVTQVSDIPYEPSVGYGLSRSLSFLTLMEEHVVSALRQEFPHVRFYFDLNRTAGIGYYTHLCFKVTAANAEGEYYPLCDGGMADWTQKLLSQGRERLLTSGIGSELFIRTFSTQQWI